MSPQVTLAAVGHNEELTLRRALESCQRAAEPGDVVVYLDSASTDASRERAAALGVDVIAGPIGKGAAVQHLLQRAETDWLVVVDADLHGSERNIAQVLRAGVSDDLSTVIGEFSERSGASVLSNTWGVYDPLVNRLFPAAAGQFGSKPLTGFRAVRRSVLPDFDEMPLDFGLEAWFNLAAAGSGLPWSVVDVGWYEGRFLYKPFMGREIGRAVLDSAEGAGLLTAEDRPLWDAWVEDVVAVVASYHGREDERADYLVRLEQVRTRPLPA